MDEETKLLDRQILALEKKAKRIKKIQFTINTILANACYSDRMLERQIEKGQNLGNLNTKEREMLEKAWAYRNKLALQLLDEAGAFLNEHV